MEWTRVQFSDYTVHNIPLPRLSMVLVDSRLTQMIWSWKMIKCEVVTIYGQSGSLYAEPSPGKVGILQMLSMPLGWQELQQ